MFEALIETIIDSIKLLPFLFVTYLVMELIENKAGDKTNAMIKKSGKFGPALGALLGLIPQCGFSAAAASLYSGRIITLGSLIAIFLATSDEMLPILISEAAPINVIIKILLIKFSIGMVAGLLIDLFFRKMDNKKEECNHIHQICNDEHCHCKETGILKSSIKHTLHVFAYIFIISLIINIVIFIIGEDNISGIIVNIPILGNLISTFIGIIPNCASSVILTQLYLEEIIPLGCLISGLLVNSGIGLLILFKVNKPRKQNLIILLILFIIGLFSGVAIDLI